MKQIRFSQKELSKNANSNLVVPKGYSELKHANEFHSTDAAYYLEYNGVKSWWPKSQCVYIENKFYAADWLIKTKDNDQKTINKNNYCFFYNS